MTKEEIKKYELESKKSTQYGIKLIVPTFIFFLSFFAFIVAIFDEDFIIRAGLENYIDNVFFIIILGIIAIPSGLIFIKTSIAYYRHFKENEILFIKMEGYKKQLLKSGINLNVNSNDNNLNSSTHRIEIRLSKLKKIFEDNLISEEDYNKRKEEILRDI